MRKIYCDICGKEINVSNGNGIWNITLVTPLESLSNMNLQFNSPMEDICERCATVIHSCITMMGESGWEPDFHEVLDHGSMWDREKAADRLNRLEEIYNRKIMK